MNARRLGHSDLYSSQLAYGCMRIAQGWKPGRVTAEHRAAGRRAVIAAYEAGYTLFDHADIYCGGVCEEIFGEALAQVGGMREHVRVMTKCGIRFAGDPDAKAPYRYDASAAHVEAACERSLRRLGVEAIDLFLLHRPDPLMDPTEVASVFERLRRAGKVRQFGVSNFSPSQVSALQRALAGPLVVNQVEIHLGDLSRLEDGTLDQCFECGITPMAWGPLGGGWWGEGGRVPEAHPRREAMVALQQLLDAMAGDYGVDRTLLALAWLLRHPARIVPIVGSTDPARIAAATRAESVPLSREDWYRLFSAARATALP
jgi:predicted oxidoreductase